MNIDTYLMNYSQGENFSPYETEFNEEQYNSPIKPALKITSKTIPSIFSNYWVDFANRAACIAEKEWGEWDKGKRHETNPAFQPKLLSYYSTTQMTSQRANRAAKSNLNKKNRSPWSAAFFSYVMKTAGAGHYFHYNSSHLNYILKAKENRIKGLKNPFQLYALNEIRPEVGDLVCNSRGCFQKTFNNVDQAKNKMNRCGDNKYEATFSHCDMVVEVDRKNNKVWVIGGNTGNEKRSFGGQATSTVGKKSRRLDSNGYLKQENKIFAILKIRKDLNVQAPNEGVIINPCSYSDINIGDKTGKQSSFLTIGKASSIGTTTTFLINKLTGLLNKGVISLPVFLAITSGNRNASQLTDMVFHARHPELNGRKLGKKDAVLIQEWVNIKNRIIIPLLAKNISPSSNKPSQSHKNPPQGFKTVTRKGRKKGLSRYATQRLDKKLIAMRSRGIISITNDDIDTFQRIANVEVSGKTQGINTWDSAVVSLGFMQLTLQHGKLQRWIRKVPFQFEKHGIALGGNYIWTRRNKKTGKLISNHQTGIKGARKGDLRWSPWAENFYNAGLDETILIAEIQLVKTYMEEHLSRIKKYLKNKRRGKQEYETKFIYYYQKSLYLRGMFQAAYNNLPMAAKYASLFAMRKAEQENYPDINRFIDIFKQGLNYGYRKLKDPEGASRLINVTKNGAIF